MQHRGHTLTASVCSLLQRVDNYEYELPSDFEDEEIDEDTAFTAADKKQFADWFADEPQGDLGEHFWHLLFLACILCIFPHMHYVRR